MFGIERIIELLTDIKKIEQEAVKRHEQERKDDLERIQRWRDEDKQAIAKHLEQQREIAEAQTRIMQEHLTTFQEKLAIEKALIQEAQTMNKRSIYNEMERERKAASRANKKNATTNAPTEETPA